MSEFLKTPQAIAAIVAAVTSILTLLLTLLSKNFIEKRLFLFRLENEFKFEQRKKIKNVIATNKSHLLNACETLSHRLWNFSDDSESYKWLDVQGEYTERGNYYFQSFAYRILAVNAWIYKIEKELIHLDTTIATKSDLEFIKFMKFYNRIFCDTAFFKGFNFDKFRQKDHLFKNVLNDLYQSVMENNEVVSFNRFLSKIKMMEKRLLAFYELLAGITFTSKKLKNEMPELKKLNHEDLNGWILL